VRSPKARPDASAPAVRRRDLRHRPSSIAAPNAITSASNDRSRDHRPDCKQVVIGLVLDRDGFPKAHDLFDGNRHDQTSVEAMLTRLEQRTGRRDGATVVVDRGMAFAKNGFMAILGALSLIGMLVSNSIVLIEEIDSQIRRGRTGSRPSWKDR